MLTAALAAALLGALGPAPPAPCADRDALREIVEERCVVHWMHAHDPAPCLSVALADPARADSGYAVLADRKGGAHLLLIPTRRISGIESSILEEPATPNYFAAAWDARARLASLAGHALRRDEIGLAVNPVRARSQDQLHIHIECLRPDVAAELRRAAGPHAPAAPRIGRTAHMGRAAHIWRPARIAGANFAILRLAGADLAGYNPFRLLAAHVREVKGSMGDYTLVVAGMHFGDGPGFALLAGTARAGELLLDSSCAVSGAAP